MFSCVSDCAEFGILKTGVRQYGFYSAYISFWHKAGIAIGSASTGWMLSALGYIPNEIVQASGVISGINFMMFGFPFILSLLMSIVFLFYTLDFKTCNDIVASIRSKYGDGI
jgi:Na+/melibiose symporter-like transporter